MTKLHQAVIDADLEGIKERLEQADLINDLAKVDENAALVPLSTSIDSCYLCTPLHLAVLKGNFQVVKLLLTYSPKIDLHYMSNKTPVKTAFEIAIKRKDWLVAKHLKEAGAQDSFNALGELILTIDVKKELLAAARTDNNEVINSLFSLRTVDERVCEYALVRAVEKGSVNAVASLLARGTSAAGSYKGLTALGVAVTKGFDAIVELLLVAGIKGIDVPINLTVSSKVYTALGTAMVHDLNQPPKVRIVELLLKYGADVKKIQPSVITAIAMFGVAEELDLLLQAGFNPNSTGYRATGNEYLPMLEICVRAKRFDLACVLLNYGADASHLNSKNRSYLHRSTDLRFTKLLLIKGFNLEQVGADGYTAYDTAPFTTRAYLQSIKFAQAKKIMAQYPFGIDSGRTCIHQLAALCKQNSSLGKLKTLLDSDIAGNVNQICSKNGKNALHFAFEAAQFYDHYTTEKNIDAILDEDSAIQTIDLLFERGALPIKNSMACTPLMCLHQTLDNHQYLQAIIDRYSDVEAAYYQVEETQYKEALRVFYQSQALYKPEGLQLFSTKRKLSDAVEYFWKSVWKIHQQDAPIPKMSSSF